MTEKAELIVRELLDRYGRLYAEDAGIRLTEFPGVGPVGASIFLREVQEIWPAVAPDVDAKVTSGANRVRLPGDRECWPVRPAAASPPGSPPRSCACR